MKEDRLRQLAEEDYDNKRAKVKKKKKGNQRLPLLNMKIRNYSSFKVTRLRSVAVNPLDTEPIY